MKKLTSILVFAFIFSAILPGVALALGQMSEPINIANAMRGQKLNQEIIAVNNENKEVKVEFSATGDIKDWTNFYKPGDLKNAITEDTAGANSSLNIIAIFDIPSDVPNGEYTGAISIAKLPDEQTSNEESFVAVTQKIDRQVTITVSDEENISLAVSVIPETYDLTPNQPLKIRIIYDNQSNISLTPSISFKIKKSEDDQTAYNVIYPYPEGVDPVNSRAQYEIPALEIPTAGLAEGKYYAQLEFTRGEDSLTQEQFGFSIGSAAASLGGGGLNLKTILIVLVIVFVIIAVVFVALDKMKKGK